MVSSLHGIPIIYTCNVMMVNYRHRLYPERRRVFMKILKNKYGTIRLNFVVIVLYSIRYQEEQGRL